MKISLEWQRIVPLQDGSKDNLIYTWDLNKVPKAPGIYIFARKFGGIVAPLYVGQAKNLRSRTSNQMNNLKLMMGIRNSADVGARLLMTAKLQLKPGQQLAKCLNLVEKAYIENALTQGFDLLNQLGVKTKVDSIESKGTKRSHAPFPRRMNARAT